MVPAKGMKIELTKGIFYTKRNLMVFEDVILKMRRQYTMAK